MTFLYLKSRFSSAAIAGEAITNLFETIDTDSTVLLDALFLKAIRAQTVFHEHLYRQESGFASSPIVVIPNTRPSSSIRLEHHPDGYLAMVHAGVNALAVFQALNRA